MLTKGIALHGMAVLLGGLIATSALAQTQMASAVPAPQHDMLVFTEKGGQLSPTAATAVRKIAVEAKASRVTLVGRPENVAPVKAALESAGVPASGIVVKRSAGAGLARPLARPSDGLSEPADRRVEIKL